MDFRELKHCEVTNYKQHLNLLIVTANQIETDEVHSILTAPFGLPEPLKVPHKNQTFYIGNFGIFPAVHVRCTDMGSTQRGGAINTVRDAISAWEPSVVLMIGVAMGVDDTKQNIGDVLVSESVIPYEIERVGENTSVKRGTPCHSGGLLVNRFKNSTGWNHKLQNGENAKIFAGSILSGEKLIDNLNFRNQLLEAYPEAIGAEMEGAGIFAACQSHRITEWLLVKGICDYGDGKKVIGKKDKQKIAIRSAVTLCVSVFSTLNGLDEVGLRPWNTTKISSLPKTDEALFDIYNPENENYYLERADDKIIENTLNFGGLWLSGPSGCGKTTLIRRHLLKSQQKFLLVTLASCIYRPSLKSLLKELYYKLFENSKRSTPAPFNDEQEAINAIVEIISGQFSELEYLYIEEIPLEANDPVNIEFLGSVASIQIALTYQNTSVPRLILSSLYNPISDIKSFQKKIEERLRFVSISVWDSQEIEGLVDLILRRLQIELSSDDRQLLITHSINKPRNVKRILRNFLMLNEQSATSMRQVIGRTNIER